MYLAPILQEPAGTGRQSHYGILHKSISSRREGTQVLNTRAQNTRVGMSLCCVYNSPQSYITPKKTQRPADLASPAFGRAPN